MDNDCLADGIEFAISTDTFEYDTDNDGYNDGDEYYGGYNPLVPGDHNDPLTIAREVFLGAILGEWAYEMPIHDNLYYMAGWMISGYAVAGDIRDVVVSITSLNGAGALLNSLCAAPVAGDIAKTLKVAEKFGAKHPDQAVKIARFVGKYVPLKTVDDKLQAIICFYGEDSAKALLDRGIQLNTLTDLAAQGVKRSDLEQLIDIHHIPAEDVLNIVRHNVDPVKLVKLLDNLKNEAYKGQWSPGKRGCSEANLDYHFRKHGPKDFGLSGNPGDAFGKQKYVDAAVESMKKQDGMEIYYDNWNHNIVKYERSTERFVVGNLDGELASLFKRPFNEIDKNLNRFIRIG
ncbi:hypothetical protein [Methanocella sp. MCL-LM]|uniref:hypothetical protein n=1 Tax=Methanocella sp. MCL-LM TaxID=3412035 RepID=UPI003C78A5AB